jgi:hypothetical protein
MRKFFGSKVVAASKASGSGSSGAQGRRQPTTVRSSLTRPQATWWPANYRQGLSSRMLTEEELAERRVRHQWAKDVPGEKVWTVEYSRKYRGLTKTFIQMVMAGGLPTRIILSYLDLTQRHRSGGSVPSTKKLPIPCRYPFAAFRSIFP